MTLNLSADWWAAARTQQIAAAARQAGYTSVADFVFDQCPFKSTLLESMRARRRHR